MTAPHLSAFLCLLCAGLPLCAQQHGYPLRVTDDTGAAVTLPARPVRIISLTLATDEMLLTLVDAHRLQGVTTFAADPAVSNVAVAAAQVPRKLDVNVETILSLDPDLVLVADWSDAGPVHQLRDAGVPVYLMSSGVTVASIESKIARLALLTGETAGGRAMIAGMEARLAALSSACHGWHRGNGSGHGLCRVGIRAGTGKLVGRNAAPRRARERGGRFFRG